MKVARQSRCVASLVSIVLSGLFCGREIGLYCDVTTKQAGEKNIYKHVSVMEHSLQGTQEFHKCGGVQLGKPNKTVTMPE
ncbi:hypothetical protein BABINDRAFT_96881 [Babjeviella inositovora NRRL Y-12698]|uniref:Uncharacterized protein n=1 Tax=Babjeviella inositovora NRRL Y-12698 TaxID=984486 RepID=A0A1E3QIY6_9ASCO|nr:uncharacterized protein BABINDRAFT_96881 [Babjeviella inositovora NRRL Y-12698]ODQ77649.1 hypothetical protein BABINDRAFT_96881 [Babjeviella inositovora NRRL Y-12698]